MKKYIAIINSVVLYGSLSFLLSPVLTAQTKSVDDMMDKLERQLKDQQDELLSIQENNLKTLNQQQKKLIFKEQQIRIKNNNEQNDSELKNVSDTINKLEMEIDTFYSEVQRIKQAILEQTKHDNYIYIYVSLYPKDKLLLKMLDFKVDGFRVFKLNDYDDIWEDTEKLLLYSGPVPIGEHSLKLLARLTTKPYKNITALKDDNYKTVEQTFNVSIPQGKFRKKYLIKINFSDTNNIKTKLEEL